MFEILRFLWTDRLGGAIAGLALGWMIGHTAKRRRQTQRATAKRRRQTQRAGDNSIQVQIGQREIR